MIQFIVVDNKTNQVFCTAEATEGAPPEKKTPTKLVEELREEIPHFDKILPEGVTVFAPVLKAAVEKAPLKFTTL